MSGHLGQVVAYIRVSSDSQSTERQDDLRDGADRVFEEKQSAKDRAGRPVLTEMLAYVREGDTIRVHSMDRLARSLADLIALITDLTERGVVVEFVKERLTFTSGGEDPYARLQMHLLGAFAEFERSIIRARQAEGIAKAKQRGAYTGRKRALTQEQISTARERVGAGVPKSVVARDLGISRQTLYSALAVPALRRD